MNEDRPLDEVIPRELSKDARLLNIDVAAPASFFGSPALYIPVAVSDSPAGRETIYRLPIGQKTLMGVYVLRQRLIRDYITRLSEDEYASSKETRQGQVVFSGKGKLRILDARVGAGEIVFESDDDSAVDQTTGGTEAAAAKPKPKCTCTRRWYVWSFIATEDCDCTGGRPPILTSLV
jgi:hypothetical protein